MQGRRPAAAAPPQQFQNEGWGRGKVRERSRVRIMMNGIHFLLLCKKQYKPPLKSGVLENQATRRTTTIHICSQNDHSAQSQAIKFIFRSLRRLSLWFTSNLICVMAESLLDGIEEEKEGSYVTSDYKSLLPESGREKATSIRASAVNEVKLMGDCKTFFTFFKSFLGTGLLLQAKGFHNSGWSFAVAILIAVALVQGYCGYILIITRTKHHGSFSELAQKSCGMAGRVLADLSLFFAQISFITAYAAFISIHLRDAIHQWSHTSGASIWYYGLFVFFLLTPILWVRKLQKFAYFHLFGDIMVVLVTLTVVSFSIYYIFQHNKGKIQPEFEAFNPSRFSLFFGSAIFAFEGIGTMIPIYDAMQNKHHFNRVLIWGMIVILLIVLIMGLVPYMAFQTITQNFVTQKIQDQYPNLWNQLLNVLYCGALVPTYALMSFPAVNVLQTCLLKGRVQPTGVSCKRTWLKNLIRTLLVALTVLLALLFSEELDVFLGYLSTIACTPVGFIFPASYHLILMKTTWWQKFIDWFIILFGAVAMIGCTVISAVMEA